VATNVHERAGKPAQADDLIDLQAVLDAYYAIKPDIALAEQQVAFGTSGHRGCSLDGSFNEIHILAITQAIVDYRATQSIAGPIYVGHDTHALSGPAELSVLEVLGGNGVVAMIDSARGFTPTPAVSVAIINHNSELDASSSARADGIIITPSHNPPRDGGIKYNPPHGGPADSDATSWIAKRANALIAAGLKGVKRAKAKAERFDFRGNYIRQLDQVVNLAAIAGARIRIGADPMGGAAVEYWGEIASKHGLNLEVVNTAVDPRFGFMSLDWDGKIRMDCSSPYSMASLIESRVRYDIATGNDADADRHGIVTADAGLMNPNHFLASSIYYLFRNRPNWSPSAAIGKTMVSSSMIDRVSQVLKRPLLEVPVGFKWFVPGLISGSIGFGGEESAGASFLKKDGKTWSTDKDGIILALLASEILAVTGETPSQQYEALTDEFGAPAYRRIDAPATLAQKKRLAQLSASDISTQQLAGEKVLKVETEASGGGSLGGIKVTTASAWFAARPSGTENVYKIYGESFRGAEHLAEVQANAQELVDSVIGSAG
jgi:phosphoglucomutase